MKLRATMIYCLIFLLLLYNSSLSVEIKDNGIAQRTIIFQEAIYFGGGGGGGGSATPFILNIVDGQRPEDGCAGYIKMYYCYYI